MNSMMEDMQAPQVQQSFGFANADIDFCTMMIPHHWGAIFMCEELVAHANTNPQLKTICAEIKATQLPQITQFEKILSNKGVSFTDPSLPRHYVMTWPTSKTQ